MTTTSRFWGSLFWGGTTSSCNDDPRSCDGDPTSCDDDPVPADRTPLVEASGMAGAPPWSPMIGSGHAPGRTDLRIAPLIAGLVGFAAGLAMLLAPATGTDLSAQQARAAFAGGPRGVRGGPSGRRRGPALVRRGAARGLQRHRAVRRGGRRRPADRHPRRGGVR